MTDGAETDMHLHRPKPLHGWREISLEVGVIVIGIVIAILLEQTVEVFHHAHQRSELTEALKKDGEVNRGYLAGDIVKAEAIADWALAQASALERAGPSGPVTLRRLPGGFIGALDAGVWPSAKASGTTNLLPSSAQNWLEYLHQEYDETFTSSASAGGQLYLAYGALDQIIIGHAKATPSRDVDLSTLTPAQRSEAVERLRFIAEQARRLVRQLVICDAGNDYILATPLEKLDSPEEAAHYMRIYGEKMKAHPAADFAFGGR
jgi:hypothetical protein